MRLKYVRVILKIITESKLPNATFKGRRLRNQTVPKHGYD